MSKEQIEAMARDMDELLVEKPVEISKHHLNMAAYLYGKGWHRQSEDVTDINVGNKAEWIGVDVQLPEPHKDVLVVDGYGEISIDFMLMSGKFACERGCTHWMPIPEPPKMKGE